MKSTFFIALLVGCGSVFASQNHAQAEFEKLGKLGGSLFASGCANLPPHKITREKNKHYPEVIDDIAEFRCPGLKITKYVAKSVKPFKILPLRVELSKNVHLAPAPYNLGVSVQDVQKKLGTPVKQTHDRMTYYLNLEGTGDDAITFVHRQGKITAMIWSWEVY
jgi:hypothetical protein